MNEPGICPLCNALQNPDTGNCLICGKHYHLLDIPTSETDNCIPSDFLVRLPNGFLTFKALVEMALKRNPEPTLLHDEKEVAYTFHDEAKITFHFVADNDEMETLYKIYCGRHFS